MRTVSPFAELKIGAVSMYRLLSHRPRRIIATVLLAVIVGINFTQEDLAAFFVYWGIFFLLFMVLIVVTYIDLKAIRASYAVAEREIFKSTLGSEEMRQMLKKLDEELKRAESQKGGDRGEQPAIGTNNTP